MAINIDIQKQTRLSGLQHPYPRQFQQAGLALAQAGKGLQNIGTDIGNFALAETQALQTTRSKRILADFTAYEISTANEFLISDTLGLYVTPQMQIFLFFKFSLLRFFLILFKK